MIAIAGPGLLLAIASCSSAGGALSGKTIASTCLGTELPVETLVSMYSVHGAAQRSSWERQKIDLAADEGALAEALVLVSYDPVGWDVSGIKNLRGVVAYGYRAPVVVGAPAGVPVRIVAVRPDGDPEASAANCGRVAFGQDGRAGPELTRVAEEALGLKIGRVENGYSTRALAEPAPADSDLDALAAGVGEDFADRGPGAGVLTAVEERGDIRRAKWSDIEAWKSRAAADDRYEAEMMMPGDTYVVVRPFTVPNGMHGAHSRNFIVPAGVAAPIDPGSHNRYFEMDDGSSCMGVECRRVGPTAPIDEAE
jgi:hypothetical protein